MGFLTRQVNPALEPVQPQNVLLPDKDDCAIATLPRLTHHAKIQPAVITAAQYLNALDLSDVVGDFEATLERHNSIRRYHPTKDVQPVKTLEDDLGELLWIILNNWW